jgi:hypothetical protein
MGRTVRKGTGGIGDVGDPGRNVLNEGEATPDNPMPRVMANRATDRLKPKVPAGESPTAIDW